MSMNRKQKVDALLHLANKTHQTERGKLKIFLGSAPGVGKTYAMLNSAHTLKNEGKDIVIGVAVTHGRKDTLALSHLLESIPLKEVQHKGRAFFELGVDQIKKRKPEIVIIDELAHSNLTHARNKKRYLDIEEILDVGIDVYTAVNIQHIASLSYEVAQITQARVNETIPDSFIQSADELVVVDVTPEELIKRLEQGKIYVQEMANRALSRYFQYTNLSILRDYTFRLAANHVGEDIRHYKKLYHNRNIVISSPSVLVCCGYSESTPLLLRRGKQLAQSTGARLLAVFIHKPKKRFSRTALREIRRYKVLANTLGYDIEHISGARLSKSILQYADEHGVSDIIIGKSKRPKWMDILFGSVVYDVIRDNSKKQIHVITTEKKINKIKGRKKWKTRRGKKGIKAIIYASILTFFSGTFIYFLMSFLGLPAQSLSFLLVLMLCAYLYGLRASVASSIIGFVMYMYMYLTPNFYFTIDTFTQIVTFCVFIIVALIISQLTVSSRMSLLALREREKSLSMLYDFSKQLSKINTDKDFREVILSELERYFNYDFVFINASNETFDAASFPQHPNFNQKELIAARWCWQHKSICGATTNTFSALTWYFEPLLIEGRLLGIIAVHLRIKQEKERFLSQYTVIKPMFSQVSQLLLKRFLETEEQKLKTLAEQQKLQKSMLSSVSHDFKTPLASIMGSLSSVIQYKDMFNQKDKEEMLTVAYDESKRLDRYIDNIMQMLKLESQALVLNKKATSTEAFINELEIIAKRRYKSQRFNFAMTKNVMIECDNMLLQQVLLNLIDNAVKFSDNPQKQITVSVNTTETHCVFQVKDEGVGIQKEDLESVFNVFYRIEKKDSYTQGNGLGLAICKGIIEAHNGEISAKSDGANQGAAFNVLLPMNNKLDKS
nr:ATP-binding protein [Fangia hongkongensis]